MSIGSMMQSKVLKVCFITNYCPHYRLPAYKLISHEYTVDFLFTKEIDVYATGLKYESLSVIHVKSIFSIIRHLLMKEYDIVISAFPSSYALLLPILTRIRNQKLIFWMEEWYRGSSLFRRFYRSLLGRAARVANAFIAVGKLSKKLALTYGVPKEKIFISPEASLSPKINPEKVIALKKRLCIDEKMVILYLGRLIEHKGLHILLKAAKYVETNGFEICLILAGDGDKREDLELLAKELSLSNIKFVGHIPFSEWGAYYQLADIYVLPSVKLRNYSEIWGLTINEAMSVGKPIVTTDAVGCAPELIKNGENGYIVRNGDVEKLAEAIAQILAAKKLRIGMGRRSKEIIKDFTYERMVIGFKTAINFVVSKGRLKKIRTE